ncbi:MAG: M2 family metallopeptidase [Flavobacteriales bacterium]|nr:M2 family metallopeptidase [Flavobacteriales bacterium]
MKNLYYLILCLLILNACGSQNQDSKKLQEEVKTYLEEYNKKFQELLIASSEAQWKLNTMIRENDSITGKKATEAGEEFAKFTGSKENIEKAKTYLASKNDLSDLQVRQLETILFMAGGNPEIAGDVVKERIKAETEQTGLLYGFKYMMNEKELSTNELDDILKNSADLEKRLSAWKTSKEVGKTLKNGLEKLRNLRNKSVQALDYSDYFAYQAAEYGMSDVEVVEECDKMIKDVWPLYRELHTWARYELAKKYNKDVPDYLPAHWLPNRWGQDWTAMVNVEGIDLDEALKSKSAEWVVEQGEYFYKSLGFDALPKSFYEKSSLYPLPPGTDYKKNNHASAWHIDNDKDVRSLMSVEPNTEWWGTVLHELGHIYYYMTYSNNDVPIILRGGANRAYHEAMGSLIGLAAMQKPFLQEFGLVAKNVQSNDTMNMLKEALDFVVHIPWGAGVMTHFEHDLYTGNIKKDAFNKTWWEYVKKFQGIVPPEERGEQYCDAATKTHINDDAAQYYDYSMSNVLLFQFHDHIAKNILKQDPHNTNYLGSKETGDFLRKLMYPGASVDWRQHLKDNLGSEMSAKPMLEYFEPLLVYLKNLNKGRTYTLPETL